MIYTKQIVVRGGSGGNGCMSFRREKYVPFGGPDGGDGGDGGNVRIVASSDIVDLRSITQGREYVADKGQQGRGWRKHGRSGDDLTIAVPMGTMIFRDEGGAQVLLADLRAAGQEVVVARGGRGGLGNTRFATAVNQAPEIATSGKPGEELSIVLEVKLVSDMCIGGHPNSGKSTLLSAMSRARPEVADYPFTTREPVLGVMPGDRRDFVVAELPGLVAGAHLGKGLGNEFLRHAERTRLLILLLDGSSPTVMDDVHQLDQELTLYGHGVGEKPKVVAVNKMDLSQVEEFMSGIREELHGLDVPVFYISAAGREGVAELAREMMAMAERAGEPEEETRSSETAVFRPRPRS
jgi:GTPase